DPARAFLNPRRSRGQPMRESLSMPSNLQTMLRKIVFLLASASFFLAGAAFPAAAQVDFPIGYVSRGGTYAFISLIEKHKFLEQEGIKPTFVYIGGPQVSQALISGDIRMAIVAAASIKTPADLKGTRLAIDRLGDYSDFRARKVLEMFGLQAQKDVTLLQI